MAGLGILDLVGWLAAILAVAGFAAPTMSRLRTFAVFAAAAFTLWAILAAKPFMVILGLVATGTNLWRMEETRRWTRNAAGTRPGDFSLDWIRASMRPVTFDARELLFRKGDPPHYIYYIKSGEVLLEEIDVTLGAGEIVGEIAFFSDLNERTLTARCTTKCEVMVIRETDFARLQQQNPAFAIYLLRLVSTRLLDGISRFPEAYRPYSALERKRREESRATRDGPFGGGGI